MKAQSMNLNIRYDAPQEIWDKLPHLYSQLDGWMGDGPGLPYWFSFNPEEKHICASVEPGGLQFTGLMDDEDWIEWVRKIKEMATRALGYKVGEIEEDDVDY